MTVTFTCCRQWAFHILCNSVIQIAWSDICDKQSSNVDVLIREKNQKIIIGLFLLGDPFTINKQIKPTVISVSLISWITIVSAMVVRFITRRYIGEYDPTLEKIYTYHTVIDNETVYFDILDTAGQPHVSVDVLKCAIRTQGSWSHQPVSSVT